MVTLNRALDINIKGKCGGGSTKGMKGNRYSVYLHQNVLMQFHAIHNGYTVTLILKRHLESYSTDGGRKSSRIN